MTKMGYELYTILPSGILLLAGRLLNLCCLVRSMKLRWIAVFHSAWKLYISH